MKKLFFRLSPHTSKLGNFISLDTEDTYTGLNA
jgi:hypothetical protein